VLGSSLALLAVTAAVLLVPALIGLLGVERHRHLAEAEDTTRRLRLVLAATLVGIAALLVVALAGGEALVAAVVAVALAGSVLVWAPLTRAWAVRGVVVWALLVSGAAGFMGWFAHTLATSQPSVGPGLLAGGVWLLLVVVLARLQPYVRAGLAGRAGLRPGASAAPTPLLRPAVSLAALLAASGAVVAVASGNGGPVQEGHPPQAGLPGSSSTTAPSQPMSPPSASTRTAGPGQPASALAGLVGVPWSPAVRVAGAGLALPPADLVAAPTCASGAAPGEPVSSASVVAGPHPSGAPAANAGGTPKAVKPTSRPSARPSSPAPGSGQGASPSPGTPSSPVSSPPPGPRPTSGTGPRPTGRPTPLQPTPPVSSPTEALTKLLGFQKEKPNRPTGAPSPGHGRPDNARTPVLPAPAVPGLIPPASPPANPAPSAAPVSPARPGAGASRTPGYEKEKPNRPAGAPSPGHGRPSAS
jgi:hypothetical protein